MAAEQERKRPGRCRRGKGKQVECIHSIPAAHALFLFIKMVGSPTRVLRPV